VNELGATLLAVTGATFFARAQARLTLDVPAGLTDANAPVVRGDTDIDPLMWQEAGVAATRPAAVLIPVVDRPEATVLLTQRTTHLSAHAGQIAFPGGKIDPGDRTPLDAALREANEEIGLDRTLVRPIGYLDVYLTMTGYRILPLVARVAPGYRLTPNAEEVADVFEVPLAFLMSAENHELRSSNWKGANRRYYAMPYGERMIYGVTAGILRNLYERLYER
jgi:8-oxo-dGTP pyrophosphatase MutT (NUDIX family)